MKEGRVLSLVLVQSLCYSGPRVSVAEETCWIDVYKAIDDTVVHPKVDLSSSVFKICPLNIFEHRCKL